VILGSDFDLLGEQVFHGMIRTVMAEFQLERFSTERQPAQLVSQAYSKHRNVADELLNISTA